MLVNQSKKYLITAIAGLLITSQANAGDVKVGGSIDIQTQKNFYEDNIEKNLEGLFGRANITVSQKNELTENLIYIRAYPAGFGYEPVVGVDSNGVKTEKVAKFQIYQAWSKINLGAVDAKIGRWPYLDSPGAVFGSYIDVPHGAKPLSRLYTVNALEITNKAGIFETQASLITQDASFDTGEIRVVERIQPLDGMLIYLGFKSNYWDRIHNEKADLKNTWDLQLSQEISKDFKPFVEIAGRENSAGDMENPILFGTYIPTGGILSDLILEMEYVDSELADRSADPLLWSVTSVKKFDNGYTARLILFSNKEGENLSALARLSVAF